MTPPFWLNAVTRSLIWFGGAAVLAYRKKPETASFAAVRGDWIAGLGGALLLLGIALHVWSNLTLAKGEREASRGASGLVTGGPYAFVRNPIYVAGLPLLVGTCLLYSTVTVADLLGGLVLATFFHLRVVLGEEPALRRHFGQRFEEYCRRVPRWIPGSAFADAPADDGRKSTPVGRGQG